MIVRRPAIDRCRRARLVYLATLNAWLQDTHDDAARLAYAAAFLAWSNSLDALNNVERALFECVKDRLYQDTTTHQQQQEI